MPIKKTTTKTAAAETVKPAAEAKKTETPAKTAAAAPAKAAEKKTPVKRAAAKKAVAEKKAADKAPVVTKEVYVQCFGKEINVEGIEADVKKAWMAETGKKESDIKDVKIYIKPEENAAYYVVNGEYKEEGNKVNL